MMQVTLHSYGQIEPNSSPINHEGHKWSKHYDLNKSKVNILTIPII